MDTDGPKISPPPATKPSLTAWAKWVQGPYQDLVRSSTSLSEQIDQWEIDFLKALTEEGVPDGSVAAMAMAVYRHRKGMQLNFVNAVFKKVVAVKSGAVGPVATGRAPAPAPPHPSVVESAKWDTGPFATIQRRDTYGASLDT